MKKKNISPLGTKGKYDPDRHPIDVYCLATTGKSNREIAAALNITAQALDLWIDKHPSIAYAMEKGRNRISEEGKSSVEELKEYIYNRLSPQLRSCWDRINMWCDHPEGAQRIEALLQPYGTKVRQSLWLHAMIALDFNAPEACRRVNVPRTTLVEWTENDPDFPKLMDEIVWAKKHFFEGALISLVKEKNVMATIFANKTQNHDLGYNEKTIVNHRVSGTVGVDVQHHFTVSIDKLNLPLAHRIEILKAIRALKKSVQKVDTGENVQEVEIIPPIRHGRAKLAIMGDD